MSEAVCLKRSACYLSTPEHIRSFVGQFIYIYTDKGDVASSEGDVVYSPRGCWHGFNNTSNEDVVLVWGWMDAGSIEASGYEVHPESHK